MASIIPQQRPSPHVAPNVPSPLRRASSHSSIPSTTTPGGSKLASPPHSRSSTSELGDIPGTYPRDPRIALEHLNDKADMTGTESSATNNGTILDAAREDWRHAVDVASSYLPGTVVGAFGYAFPFGTTNPEETEKKLQEGGVDRAPRESTKFKFEPKDVAVGGIVSDFNPLSSRSRATPSSTSGVGAISNTPKKPFTSPSVGHALDSTAPKSESESNSKNDALGPTAVSASKEKKDDDVQEISTKQPQSQSSDLRKRAIETAALGAGIGTLGGAAYESSRSPAQPSSKVNPKAEDLTSPGSSGSVASEQSVKEQPAFATYAPAPVITDTSSEDTAEPIASASDSTRPSDQASSASTSVWDTRGRSDAQKALNPHRASGSDKNGEDKKRAIQAAALGAGIGTVGGATYAHSHSPKDAADQVSPTGTAQPGVSGGKSEDISSATARGSDPAAVGASGGRLAEDQPAFVSYAPAPIITEDYSPDVPEDDEEGPPTSSVRDERPTPTTDTEKSIEKDDSDSPGDSRARKGVEGAALGAGAGALGGAAYQHSRENDKQKGDVAVAPAGYANKTDETKPATKEARVNQEKQSFKTRDTQNAADQDVPTHDAKAKKRAEGAALGAGAGVLGGAAYAHSRRPDQDAPVDSTATTTSPTSLSKETPSTSGAPTDSQPQPASKPAAPSTDTSGPKDIQKASSESDAAGDSTVKGFEGLAVGARAGQASSKTSGTVPSQMQTPGKQGQKEEAEKESIAPQDSKIKKGFWSAALVAGAGVLGGAALHYSHKNGEDDSNRMTEGSPASQSQSQSQPQHQIQPESHSKANTDQSTGAGGDKDAQSTDKKGMAAAAATGAGVGAIGTGLVSDKKSETDQHAESRKKEAEKREKDMKRHEKDSVAPVAASSSDKRSAAKKEDKRDAKEAEKQHQAAKREKEVKKHEKDVIAAEAVAGDSKRAKRAEGPKETTQSQQGEKVAADAKTKDQSKGLAAGTAGGTALGAGTGLAANSLSDAQKHQPSDELSPATTAQQTNTDLNKSSQQQVHPSIKAASDPPHRPGPIAHGAAGPYDVPRSGADSDFPLPSANASSTDVAKTVDIDGSGKPSTAEDNKFDSKARSKSGTKTANTAAGVVTAGGAAGQYGDKSRYHASEGPQEKHEGGVLRSSTIERMKNGKNGNGDGSNGNGNGNGNGHGKKEGFVKHMVDKVKDKLHHHDK
ncbi:hypothetical protein ACEPAF_8341 [Sanghuangporus sanghuang]